MNERSYHHGNLRAALLAEAERTLREQGMDRLSLRELARQAGVSHAAPRRHFADRQALLDALAEVGYIRLGEELSAAIDTAEGDSEARLRAAGTAWIGFATRNASLLELMYAAKQRTRRPAVLEEAHARLFATFDDLIRQGQQAGELRPGDPDRLRRMIFVALQGVGVLVASGNADAAFTDELIADMAALFAHGPRDIPIR